MDQPFNGPLSGNKYQVFLSFNRGKDTENSFPSRLCSSLREAGISVLKGDIPLEQLLSSIEGCRISIIIFSERYPSSRRCLVELTKIMEFHRAHDQVVIPIFYDVHDLQVENKLFGFGKAFQDLIQTISPSEDEVSRWSAALREAGSFDKLYVSAFKSSHEIQLIVTHVRHKLDTDASLATDDDGLVGVGSKVKEVMAMLDKHESKDVVSLGIWGMAVIGKTTLARAIFKDIRGNFEISLFLSDVGETWKRKGEVGLQEAVASVICEGRGMRIDDSSASSSVRMELKRRLRQKKVLVVADDVDDVEQLHALWGNCEWFDKGKGSRIIITTTDLHILNAFPFDDVYLLKPVSDYESLQLFCMSAFQRPYPELGFIRTSRKMAACCKGLPLALKLLGSLIYLLEPDCWETILDQLKDTDPQDDISYKILELRMEYFEEERDIFLNIVAFHIGEDINDVRQKLDDRYGRRLLGDRSIVTIDENNKLRMHNVLQEFGRKIMLQRSQHYPHQGYMYEVFLSFRGEDTRTNFTSHLHSALCNASINVFKDDVDLPKGTDILPGLLEAIRTSKIAIIIFSEEYAGSKWCLEELSLIMELHKSNDKVVLPVFYCVAPSDIRNQTSSFGQELEFPTGGKPLLMLQPLQGLSYFLPGIWGMGGMGKSTIAKAIYNEIGHYFQGRCYLPNIREAWSQEKDRVSLQNKLLSQICKPTKMEIDCIESGKITLKDRLCHKKALVVLDDVDDPGQLKALVGGRDCWFGPGSRIIITTRNNRLLEEIESPFYMMKKLDRGESIKLFSWHAFKQESPEEDFTELSIDIVAYSGGLPLALEVLGSYLFGREVDEWKSVLERLKEIPFDKIHEKLKISFDGLSDQFNEKDIFLDIACFFVGMDKNEVTQILNGCRFAADIGIKTLVERSLVTTDENNKLGMHDLLRDMGREIVREQSENELGKRSRLWFHKDARAVLLEDMGTEAIQGLSLKLSESKKKRFQTKAFEPMKTLRLLHLEHVQLEGDYEYMSRDLRWLCWHGIPLKYIPRNFYQKKLVAIDIKYSSLKRVWKEPQVLKRLKILNLSHSPDLLQTPDFSKLPNLEKLILKDCPSLSMIHDSIGLLHKLLLLDMEDCVGLLSLPRSIYKLKCLKTLILSGCKNVQKLEEDIEQMESLTTLIAPTIKQVPFSLVRLKSILYLSVCGHEGLSNHVIPPLCRSWISPTNNPLPHIPSHAGMPSSFLWKMLNRIHGRRLPTILSSDKPKQQRVLLEDRLELPDSNSLGHHLIQIGQNTQVFHELAKRVSQGLYLTKYKDDCILPDDNYPYWLTFEGEGASVKFQVPTANGRDHLKGITNCTVYVSSRDSGNMECESCIISLLIINYTKTTTLQYEQDSLTSLEGAEMKEIISNLDSGDQVEVMVVSGNGFTVKKMAVYLIYKESFDEQMEPSTSEAANLSGSKHKCEDDDDDEEEEEEEEAHQSIRPRKAHQNLIWKLASIFCCNTFSEVLFGLQH